MPEAFTVHSFASKGSKPNPHGGVLHKWEVSLTDGEGETHHGVYWQSKSDELHIGQEVYGEITDGEYGPRFRTAQRENGAPRASQGGSGTFSKDDYWTRRDERDVESQARQGRAHAQEMALRREANRIAEGKGGVNSTGELASAIDWFHQDVQRFPLDADVGGGTSQNQDEVRSSERQAAADVTADQATAARALGHPGYPPKTPVEDTVEPTEWLDEGSAPPSQEASTAQKRKLTELFNKAQLAKEAQKAIVLYRCRSEKATKDGASQLISDLTEGATAESLLAEISDGRRAGNPLAARAAALIPTDVPNAEPGPEYTEEDKKHDDDIPF